MPRKVVSQLSLSEGDKFEVRVKDGNIFLIPVAVYPKSHVSALGNLRKLCCADLLRILSQFEAKKRRRRSATARLFGKEVRQKAR